MIRRSARFAVVGLLVGFGVVLGVSSVMATTSPPVVGGTSSAAPAGYWLAAADGGVFTYGAAPFLVHGPVDI